ncbi:cytochrome P450 [Arthrobacter sp. SW1]|uniref:cytochrome P450 n=1 Tax=Arthrobacter sp. SW1 TaxID=1920889 RepID=UPI00209B1355|nr:cytochrome P450 [Arthrobacter sp. SW1]
MRGAEAAEFFYDGGRFVRARAIPRSAKHLLQDAGSVQALEGEAHRHRKDLFIDVAEGHGAQELGHYFDEEWDRAEVRRPRRIILYEDVSAVLASAVFRWSGLPVDPGTAALRARDLQLMVEQAAGFGPANWHARRRRRAAEAWARDCVRRLRSGADGAGGSRIGDTDSAGHHAMLAQLAPALAVALHRDLQGRLLPEEVAAVELLNLFRPVVAVGRYIVFAALALHRHPEWRPVLAGGDKVDLECFAQEVRRFYPFFPFVAGTARQALQWHGHSFTQGDWAILDLYGSNHDPRIFEDPGAFQPERFRPAATGDVQPGPFGLIPQGAGDPLQGHRCPGEDMTMELLHRALRILATDERWTVPAQDLTVDLAKIPALPRSGLVLERRRRR